MIASRAELEEMRRALEGALGLGGAEDAPEPVRDWRAEWASLCALGLTTFTIPEDQDGFGLEASAGLVASRALGAALHGSPYPSIVCAAYVLSRGLDPALRKTVVEAIASGECVPTLAFLDPDSRIEREGGAVRVRGRARLVVGAAESDAFLAIGRTAGESAFVSGRDGVALSGEQAFDVTRSVADVSFDGAVAEPIDEGAFDPRMSRRLFGLLLAGDAIGGAERMLERTRRYVLEREAFGRPIGGFQAVQHRLVDHALRLRAVSLLATDAAAALGRGAPDAERRVLLAEIAAATDLLPLLHDLVQLNGGVAFTWEHGLHYYERRAVLDARVARNPRAASQTLARVEGWVATD